MAAGPTAAPYQQIASHFRAEIETGALRTGDRLPTVREIAQTWGVARPTADKALALLRADGLVTTARRGGTSVADTDGLSLTVAVDLPASALTVTSTELTTASTALADELGVKVGSAVMVVRLRLTEHN